MVSIIIPVYNKCHYVVKTLQSVLAQTYQNWEAIVIDDGSTDNSVAEIKTIKDPRIQLYLQDNHGVSYTRNKGIKMAKGEFIALLDADDTWFSDYLEVMMLLVEKFPKYSVFCVAQKNRPINSLPSGISFIDDYCSYPYIFWTGGMLIRKSVFSSVGDFRVGIQLGEDVDMWLRICCKYHTVYLNEPHVEHPYVTENNLARTYNPQKIYPFWEWYNYPYPNKSKLKKYTTNTLVLFANHFVDDKQFSYALKFLFKTRGFNAIRPRLRLLLRIILRK